MAGTKQQVEGIAVFRANTLLATSSDAQKSLDGINVLSLPDRSTAFVEENASNYRYNQSLPGPAVPPTSIAPLVGPGLWVLDTSSGGGGGTECCGDFSYFGAPVPVVLPGFTVAGLPPLTPNTGATWTADPNNGAFSSPSPGVIRYDGSTPCLAKLELQYLVVIPAGSGAAFLALGFNVDGVPVPPAGSKLTGCSFEEDRPCQILTSGLVNLSPGSLITGLIGQAAVAAPGTLTVNVLAAYATITCCGCGGGGDGGVFASRLSQLVEDEQTINAGAGPTMVTLDTIDFDQLGIADEPLNALVILQPGKYLVGAFLNMSGTATKTFGVYVNGTPEAIITGALSDATVQTVLELAPGDVVRLFCDIPGAAFSETVVDAHLYGALLNGGVGSGTASLESSKMRSTVIQPLPGGATTALTFDVSEFDDLGIVDLAGDRFVIASAGRYLVGYQTTVSTDPAVSMSHLVTRNGTAILGDVDAAGDNLRTAGSLELDLLAGDIIQSVVTVAGASPANDTATSPSSNTPVLWIVRLS